MKCAVILLACIAAAHCMYYVPRRPNYDCEKICKPYIGRGQKCSQNGKTFKSDCHMECAWEYEECDGPCPCLIKVQKEPYCVCPKSKKPVCGYDGNTYDNKCIADCKNKPILHDGRCAEWYS